MYDLSSLAISFWNSLASEKIVSKEYRFQYARLLKLMLILRYFQKKSQAIYSPAFVMELI